MTLRNLSKSPCPDALIIGLTGPRDSGKTTMARYLCQNHSFALIRFQSRMRGEIDWMNDVKAFYESTGHYARVVADNVLFQREADAVEELGGVLVSLNTVDPATHERHQDQPAASIDLHNPTLQFKKFNEDTDRIVAILLEEMTSG